MKHSANAICFVYVYIYNNGIRHQAPRRWYTPTFNLCYCICQRQNKNGKSLSCWRILSYSSSAIRSSTWVNEFSLSIPVTLERKHSDYIIECICKYIMHKKAPQANTLTWNEQHPLTLYIHIYLFIRASWQQQTTSLQPVQQLQIGRKYIYESHPFQYATQIHFVA